MALTGFTLKHNHATPFLPDLLRARAVPGRPPVLAKPGHAPDARLLGRWRSDRELTVKGWCFERSIDDATRARFEGLFGKLMLTFSHSHVTSLSEGVTTSRPSRALAQDGHSVVIQHSDAGCGILEHIHFEGDHFYKLAGPHIEYFRRADP